MNLAVNVRSIMLNAAHSMLKAAHCAVFALLCVLMAGCAQTQNETKVVLEIATVQPCSESTEQASSESTVQENLETVTPMGEIELLLYDDTPLHKANFVEMVESGWLEGKIFNRVIADFMIQCGYEQTENTIEPEIHYPKYYHRRGMLAMGRSRGDLLSNSEQFYIVWGKPVDDEYLARVQERIFRETGEHIEFPDEIRAVYHTVGGTPHLDSQFTIFGEVTKGLDVVEAIQAVETDSEDKPLADVVITKAYLTK